MSLAKANLCSKVPLRGTLGSNVRPEKAPRALNKGNRSYFKLERTTGKVRKLKDLGT